MPSPSQTRPGIWGWIGLGILVVLTLGVVGMLFSAAFPGRGPKVFSLMREESVAPSTGGVSGKAFFGYEAGRLGEAYDMAAPNVAPAPPKATAQLIVQRMIKTADLALRVEDAAKSVDGIRQIANAKGGYVESSSISDPGSGPRSAWVTVRVPVERFEDTLRELKGLATLVLNESLRGQDVTEQFVDLEADLRNARAEEQSYLEILKRAGDIEDVLAVTQRLADVRGRIERLEGQMRYLENRTELATIAVSVTEDTRVEVPSRSWRPLEVARQALRDLVVALQALVDFVIRALVAVIGLLLPIALLVWLLVWLGLKVARFAARKFRK